MTLSLDKLKELMAKATKGEWELWTGCSYRRIGVKNAAAPHIYAHICSDGQPDIAGHCDLEYIVAIHNAFPSLIERLESAEGALKEMMTLFDDRCYVTADSPLGIARAHLARYGKE